MFFRLTRLFCHFSSALLPGPFVKAWVMIALTSLSLGLGAQVFDGEGSTDESLLSVASRARIAASIEHYRELASKQAWTPAPHRSVDASAGSDLNLVQRQWLVKRLQSTGELPRDTASESAISGERLGLAIEQFQRRHGLFPDGKLWPATWQALNTSPQDRVRQLVQSLAELNRLANVVQANRYLLVNIPAFELIGVQNERVEIRSAVVVGKPTNPTPVLNTRVRAVNFHPRWHVPPSIVTSRLYPSVRDDPHFLAREGYELFHAATRAPLSREQALTGLSPGQILFEKPAGPRNPLGRIRLDMPNADAIFLHDSPQTWLYSRPERALSAGCVRVARIVELTAWLLADTPLSDLNELGEVLRGFEPQTVTLAEPVPIYLAYILSLIHI